MANCKCKEFLETVSLECDWKDMGLLGACFGSLGALAGMVLPDKYKNAAAFTAGSAFFFSAIALVVRTIEASRNSDWDEDEYEDFEEWETWDDEEDDEDPGFVMKITAEE